MMHVGDLKAHDLDQRRRCADYQPLSADPARAPRGLLTGIVAGALLWIAAILAALLLR